MTKMPAPIFGPAGPKIGPPRAGTKVLEGKNKISFCFYFETLDIHPDIYYTASKGGKSMAYSEAQKRATLKYRDKAYERMEILVKRGMKEELKAHAAKQGLSFNSYVLHLIEKDMKEGDEP